MSISLIKSLFVVGVLALSLTVLPATVAQADRKTDNTVKGGLIGAGVGALIGGGKGAAAGGIVGAIIGNNQ